MTYRLLTLSSAILVVSSLVLPAGAADLAEELRFAQALRADRYYDLAEQQLGAHGEDGVPCQRRRGYRNRTTEYHAGPRGGRTRHDQAVGAL